MGADRRGWKLRQRTDPFRPSTFWHQPVRAPQRWQCRYHRRDRLPIDEAPPCRADSKRAAASFAVMATVVSTSDKPHPAAAASTAEAVPRATFGVAVHQRSERFHTLLFRRILFHLTIKGGPNDLFAIGRRAVVLVSTAVDGQTLTLRCRRGSGRKMKAA
jgi:hypothetical protein